MLQVSRVGRARLRCYLNLASLVAAVCLGTANAAAQTLVVASKAFTESVIIGEIATQLLRDAGFDVTHKRQLGGTRVLWNAMLRGDIDVYPEYTGTLKTEILASEAAASALPLAVALARHRVQVSAPIGFNNTYVLGMREQQAQTLSISRISDLLSHPDLRFGFSNEFMDRADGFPGLRTHYRLPQTRVSGMEHALAYRGLAAGDIDLTDLYSTDAEIAHYRLLPLEDDLRFFPDYDALFAHRDDLPPRAREVLQRLAGRIDEARMIALNAKAQLDQQPEGQVASDFIREEFGVQTTFNAQDRWQRIWQRTAEHLLLVAISLSAAIALAVPLGILAFRHARLGQSLLAAAGILQTMPALALLVFLIPWFGIGQVPAMVALFLYSLLPILRNTHAGLAGIAIDIRESAQALGLPSSAQLLHVELPLAMRSILAGIKTAAVINIGTATLGALIGAGGYGQPILTGIRLDDTALILEGAIPAAVLALLAQLLFDRLERRWVR